MMGTADVEKMLYFRHRSATDKEELLSDKTWDDLNGEALFVRVDRTSSAIGRQYLYSLLRYDRVSGVSRCEEVTASRQIKLCARKYGSCCVNWILPMLIA